MEGNNTNINIGKISIGNAAVGQIIYNYLINNKGI